MKTTLFAGLVAALALAGMAAPASAQDFGRDRDGYRDAGYHDGHRGDRGFRDGRHWGRANITIRDDGRVFQVNRDDRMFYRLLDRPYRFQPGLTYSYTDRCNRFGCVVFVFDGRSRRPIDRIFAAHLPMRWYRWQETRGFDSDYRGFGRYDRDERGWNNADERSFREGRDGRRPLLEGRVR
jgi:hypothetical protein